LNKASLGYFKTTTHSDDQKWSLKAIGKRGRRRKPHRSLSCVFLVKVDKALLKFPIHFNTAHAELITVEPLAYFLWVLQVSLYSKPLFFLFFSFNFVTAQ